MRVTPAIASIAIASLLTAGCSQGRSANTKMPTSTTAAPASSTTSVPRANLAPTGFHVSGNQILDGSGRPFIARGLEIYDVSSSNWKENLVRDASVGDLSPAEFQAASQFWHANLIRMQLTEDDLLPSSPPGYLAEIDSLVSLANSDGMAVIVSDQTEETSNSPAPTAESVSFWSQVARHFASNPSVIFDLFNEWRIPNSDLGGESQAWALWQKGGTDPATGRSYVGMQELVNTVRQAGATNLILAQGIGAGGVLDQVTSHQLTGGDIAYAVHPYFNSQEASNPTSLWDERFGTASQAVPVMADEWGEYQSAKAECFPGAPALVPQLFAYLSAHKIGLVGWALFPGVLIRGWSWTTPTAFDQASYSCGSQIPFPDMSQSAQGAGAELLRFFTGQ